MEMALRPLNCYDERYKALSCIRAYADTSSKPLCDSPIINGRTNFRLNRGIPGRPIRGSMKTECLNFGGVFSRAASFRSGPQLIDNRDMAGCLRSWLDRIARGEKGE